MATDNSINLIQVYARNTSLGFWQKLMFKEYSPWLENELFTAHGISFKKMLFMVSEKDKQI